MKIQIFKKKNDFKKGGFHTNPDVCWEIVLYIAFAAVLAALVFGLYLFKQTNTEFVLSDTNTPLQAGGVTKERVDKVLQYFSVRQDKSTQILNSAPTVIDPSL